LLALKIVPSLTEVPIFQIALQQKDPAPPCSDDGSHLHGGHLPGRAREERISTPRDTHCG
jgi:hypothetical protein